MIGPVLINGVDTDGMVPVVDSSVIRGDGCFEVIRFYRNRRPFALDRHLDRLEMSAKKMSLEMPARNLLEMWVRRAVVDDADCVVRVVVTRGAAVHGSDSEPLVVVFSHTFPTVDPTARLMTVPAPWHAAGHDWALAGAKILSYAPNMSASRIATAAGYDDALLTTVDGIILEGSTFSVAWVVDGVLETPTLELGILSSITRATVLDLASELDIPTRVGHFHSDRVTNASEVMAWSTIREVQAVSAVNETTYRPGEITSALAVAFDQLLGSSGS